MRRSLPSFARLALLALVLAAAPATAQTPPVDVVVALHELLKLGCPTIQIIVTGYNRLDNIERIKQFNPVTQAVLQLGVRKQKVLTKVFLRNPLLYAQRIGLLFQIIQ